MSRGRQALKLPKSIRRTDGHSTIPKGCKNHRKMAAPSPPHQARQHTLVVFNGASSSFIQVWVDKEGGLHLHPLEMSPGYSFSTVLLSASHVTLAGVFVGGDFEITGNNKAFVTQGCGEWTNGGIGTPQQVPWSLARCQQSLLAQSPHLGGGVSDDQKSLTMPQLHPSPQHPQEVLPAPPHLFGFLPWPCSQHFLTGSGWVHVRVSRRNHCHCKDMARDSVLCRDLGKQQQGVPATYLLFVAVIQLEGLEFLLIFPGDWL